MNIHEIDRSGVLSLQKCPRDRFYSRHFNGTGIEKNRKSLPLCFGGAFHEGVEILLQSFAWSAESDSVELAVGRANKFLTESFANSSVDLEEKETAYAIEEQKAISEGLIRGWWLRDGERFLRDFEVIEVEKEGRAELAPGMVLMFRPDALVRERISGDLYIVSWKTASTFGQYTINQIQTDMQSMSEVWGRLSEEKEKFESCFAGMEKFEGQIEGVLYLFAVKGQRRMDDYLGFKTQDTPLAYGWMRPGPTPDDTEWAFRYKWPSEDGQKQCSKCNGFGKFYLIADKTYKFDGKEDESVEVTQCPTCFGSGKVGGAKFSQLGKGFRKVPIWSDYPGGVKAWIDALSKQEITPRHINALEAIFPQSMPVSRRADEIESWRRQVVGQEENIVKSIETMSWIDVSNPKGMDILDYHFPQHTARCMDYNSKCSFWEACHLPAVKADPLASGLYKIRVPNHPSEKGAGDD